MRKHYFILILITGLFVLPVKAQKKVLGIFTDNPNIIERVNIDDMNYHLYLWENTLRVVSTTL